MSTWMCRTYGIASRQVGCHSSAVAALGRFRWFVSSWVVVLALAAVGVSQDRVTLRTHSGDLRVWEGQVQQYDAAELRIKTDAGSMRQIPTEQIVSVETARVSAHDSAEQARRAGNYPQAVEYYRQAYREESRSWVRHEIVGQCVICYQQTGQFELAALAFVGLVAEDPRTRFWPAIPLVWSPALPDEPFRRRTLGWLEEDQPAVARLIAASWLLSGQHRLQALRVLKQLRLAPSDLPMRPLAATQEWRAKVVLVDEQELEHWQTLLRQLPWELRAGPSYLLAQALARHDRTDAATIAYLQAAWSSYLPDPIKEESRRAAANLLSVHGHPLEAERILAD